jgi:uncharacterized membrane protein YGL010W
MVLSLLTATAYAYHPDGIRNAIIIQIVSWVAQFLGHGLAEGRAPALLDNIVGGRLPIPHRPVCISYHLSFLAFVLAPFFVHLELLFMLGYRPSLHKQLQDDVAIEIAKIKGKKQRLAKKKSS